jgi:Asp-tRNA(Asn)/Glu-tRNA(Gln) amidotransferase A subunit family amidase
MEPFDVQGSSIADTSAALAARAVSVPELTGEFLARIERVDRGPVDLRSVLETNPDAVVSAPFPPDASAVEPAKNAASTADYLKALRPVISSPMASMWISFVPS